MIEIPAFRGRNVAVLGLARSGLVAAQALVASGAAVLAWDDAAPARDTARQAGIPIGDLAAEDPHGWAALVLSPGIPLTHNPHPVAAAARAANVPVIGDIELLWRAGTGARFVGITGTNGKSTTTALTAHILDQAGVPSAVGGNLGIPVLSLPRLGADGVYVVETSSFQLDLVDQARFEIAVLLNLTPDHLDRHGDMAGYIAAKRRIFRRQREGDTAIVAVDDANCRAIATNLEGGIRRLVRISAERPVPGGIWVADGILLDDTGEERIEIADLRPVPTLPGRHNWQNAAAAYAVCRSLGLAADVIAKGLATYPGLAHRQELVGQIGHVRFVNDSKATNADAAAKALACYERIYWIAGGLPKAGGITALSQYFPRIAEAFLIGSAAESFGRTIGEAAPWRTSETLGNATRQAAAAAAADPASSVVLLSPACASYDQFLHFEARGDAFRQLVRNLAATGPAAGAAA